ncbi:MAG: DNA replication and repair protein RecF [Saprospiraceae bacterium]|nr:DNA replication and repair protein RecF [Saprospiraceae bacterium]
MHFDRVILTEFKNYHYQQIDCNPRLNCFVGLNGMGKTNLLDAIYYLCMGKSYFGLNDQYIAYHESPFFRLEGHGEINGHPEKIVVKAPLGQRKTMERNDLAYERLGDHVGLIPVVFAAPDDIQLIHEGSEARRRLLDNTLSQLDQHYLQQLLRYNHLLKQRNAALKQFTDTHTFNPALLAVYDEQLVDPAQYIYKRRSDFMERFLPLLKANHYTISGKREEADCRYESPLQQSLMADLLRQNLDKDRLLGRTTGGIHRDDLQFLLEGQPIKRFASQGQTKSFLLALKLAQYDLMREEKNMLPLLLLDDIFDKLDQERVEHLMQLLLEGPYGQLFVSDTHPDRIAAIAARMGVPFFNYYIEKGVATLQNEFEI